MTAAKKIKLAGIIAMSLAEWFVLLEILWYYLHDGEQTLHGAIGEYLEGLHERAQHEMQVQDTVEMIRDLPETDDA